MFHNLMEKEKEQGGEQGKKIEAQCFARERGTDLTSRAGDY